MLKAMACCVGSAVATIKHVELIDSVRRSKMVAINDTLLYCVLLIVKLLLQVEDARRFGSKLGSWRELYLSRLVLHLLLFRSVMDFVFLVICLSLHFIVKHVLGPGLAS